jgi:RNA polymerase sigma factor (sigma-70 family)
MQGADPIPVFMGEIRANSITEVVKDYSRRLTGFIRKRVKNEADAEDILQDVFYQLLGNKEPIDHMASWLFTVARNKIIDRSRKKQPVLADDLFTGEEEDLNNWMMMLADDSANPETVYLRKLFGETLRDALDELPEEQKQAFVLHELEGIPFSMIAEKTGTPVNTLISRKHYAILYLRERLLHLYEALKNF